MTSLAISSFSHDGLSFQALSGGSGTSIVFLHGGHSRASHFRAVMERLSSNFHVIAYDMRGFGNTGADARPLSHRAWAEDVVACLNHFHLPSAFVVGWSLGAAVALNSASLHPDKVDAMALFGAPRPGRRFDAAVYQRRLEIIDRGGDAAAVVAETFDPIAQTLSPQTRAQRPDVLELVRQELLADNVALLAKCMEGYLSQPDWNVVLPTVRCPVTLFVGDADIATPYEGAQEIVALVPQAHIREVPDCGHYYAVEQPEVVARMIAEAASA